MRYLSLFSGIEAASAAWAPLGWECAAVAEVEAFPNAVLAHHYPTVPNLGDVTKITEDQVRGLGAIDVVVGGFPCQDLSVAGKRAGLKHADGTATRSGLFYDAARIARWASARFVLVENVPGLFSSNSGRDFACVVSELAGCEFGVPPEGWGNCGAAVGPCGLVEWCVLDAQFFGLAQRRKRVFIVLDTGNWRGRPPILLESASLRGDPAPSREAGKGTAPTISSRPTGGGGLGTDFDCDGGLVSHSLRAEGFDASEDGTGRGIPLVAPTLSGSGNRTGGDRPPGTQVETAESLIVLGPGGENISHAVSARDGKGPDSNLTQGTVVAFAIQNATRGQDQNGLGIGEPEDPMFTLDQGSQHAIAFGLRSDAMREGEAKTPSPDAEGRVRLRDPGFNFIEEGAPTLDTGAAHIVAFAQNTRDEVRELGGNIAGALPAQPGMKQQTYIAFAIQERAVSENPDAGPDGIGVQPDQAYTLESRSVPQAVAFDTTQITNKDNYSQPKSGDPCHPLAAGAHAPAIAFDARQSDVIQYGDKTGPLDTDGHTMGITQPGAQVRRLTPRECARLQGFSDSYLDITYRGKPAADGPKYKALGNSMAVPCMAWIGQRIMAVGNL